MKMSRRENICTNVPLVCVWIFMNVFGMISTIESNWTKYRLEAESVEAQCFPYETQLSTEDVDLITCGRMSYTNQCPVFFYQPESHSCIGCQGAVLGFSTTAALTESSGSLLFSNRDFHIDCKDILERDEFAESGVYSISSANMETVQVYCDMTSAGGGWTVFQRRFDGITEFVQPMSAYEEGFGTVSAEFWLGLKHIQHITRFPSELNYVVTLMSDNVVSETYDGFKLVGDDYRLLVETWPKKQVSGGTSNKVTRFSGLNGSPFMSNDQNVEKNGCDVEGYGGWWSAYPACLHYNFNIQFGVAAEFYGSENSALKSSTMMVRRN